MRSSNLARIAVASRGLLAIVALGSSLIACSSSSTPKENPAVADAGTSSPPPAAQDNGPTGSNCTSLTLAYSICTDLSTCPGLTIDPIKFPHCGYAVHGDVIDPECLCYGSLCPMGGPATCADMAALLAATTPDIVCQQFSSGHCLNMGGISPTSPCELCRQNCGSDPNCLNNCGC